MKKKVVILASGEGSVAQSLFDATAEGALEDKVVISSVITENSDAGIIKRAERAGIPTCVVPFRAGNERAQWERELQNVLRSFTPWLVVSAGFMKVLSPAFVREFQIINTHPSLLPEFPGAHAVRDALAAGARESGCTLHYIDEGVDTGPIIAQRRLLINDGESEESLHARIKILERELLVFGILSLLEKGQ